LFSVVSVNINQFCTDLSAGLFLDEKGNIIMPYFQISSDIIELLPGISDRLRLVTWNIKDYLGKCGLDPAKDDQDLLITENSLISILNQLYLIICQS